MVCFCDFTPLLLAVLLNPLQAIGIVGEYIATAAKLQVGHPPGAPFFQMVGAVFAILAPNPEYIALSVNMMSVLASSFTVLFLFWTITGLLHVVWCANKPMIITPKSLVFLDRWTCRCSWICVTLIVFGSMPLRQKSMPWRHVSYLSSFG